MRVLKVLVPWACMKLPGLVPLALSALFVTALPGSVATIDNCTVPAPLPNSALPIGPLVVGSQAHRDFTYNSPCWSVVGGNINGNLPACNAGNSGLQQWCGTIVYPASTLIQCIWWSLTLTTTIIDYVVGVDMNGDGHILFNDDRAYSTGGYGTVPMGSFYYLTFVTPAAGSLIAYPVSDDPVNGGPGDASVINCI